MIEFTKTPAGLTVISSSNGQIIVQQDKDGTRVVQLSGRWDRLLPIVAASPGPVSYHRAACTDDVAIAFASAGFSVWANGTGITYFRKQ